MVKKLFPFLLLICYYSICFAQKQSIIQAEYFIGDDPGEGKGVPINLSNFGDATVKITWKDLPKLSRGQYLYVRVKSSGFIDNNGRQIPGVWSLPMLVKYPTDATIKSAQAKIIRPSLNYPILKAAWATDGKFDNVIESVTIVISKDSLMIGDTLMIRLQGYCDLWGDWVKIPITKEVFTSISETEIHSQQPTLIIQPNPTADFLFVSLINCDVTNSKVVITDVEGRVVSGGDKFINVINTKELKVTLDALQDGVYYITIIKENFSLSKPFVIRR